MTHRTGISIAPLLLLAAAPAGAQDSTTQTGAQTGAQTGGIYQLPPGSAPTPNAQGPVVPDAPPPRVATTPATEPRIETPPAVTLPPPSPTPVPVQERPASSRSAPAAPPRPTAEPAPGASSPASIAAPPTAPAPTPPVEGPPLSTPSEVSSPATDESGKAVWWPLLGAGLVGLLALGAWLLRRRKNIEPDAVFERPVVPASAAPVAPARPLAQAHSAPAAALSVDLEAARMSASLVNATLAYRIVLGAAVDLGPVEVRADMTSAHASRGADEQLGGADAPVLHRLPGMAAGETVLLEGEVRLPLSAITPIRHGSAALFVPLVRMAIAAAGPESPLNLRRAYVIGLEENTGGNGDSGRLQPFRLDLGPRIYPQVGRRELTVPAFA